MPLPKPNKGEERSKFISRCISFAVGDGMPQEQAVAACHTTWRSAKGIKEPKSKMNLKFNYQVPIIESAFINDDFIITGIALNAITTSNNHKFLAEELRKSATTLSGVPLLIDHRNEVEAIKGRVISGEFDEEESRVDFRAHVIDSTIQEMIKDGRINSVSVGAAVEELEETDDGFFIPRGIEFKELSLVAVPADAGATFTVALQEAYDMAYNKEITEYSNADEVKRAMAKFNKIKFKSNEEKTEARLSILKAGRKFKIDTIAFEKQTSTQTEAKYNQSQEGIKLNISGGKIMESEDTKKQEDKVEDTEKDTKDTSGDKDAGVTEEKLQDMISKAVSKAVKDIKAADEDEGKSEDKTEDKSEEAKDADTEEGDDEGSSDEATTEEKGKYKIVQGHGSLKGGSFTLVRT